MPQPWLLLIHHIPPKPGYLRAKAARRLAALGAVALKNSVYLLPDGEGRREGFAWLAKEITDSGGRAFCCAGEFFAGAAEEELRALFQAAREPEFTALAEEVRGLLDAPPGDETRDRDVAALAGLRQRYDALRGLDFFPSPGRGTVEGLLAAAQRRLEEARGKAAPPAPRTLAELTGLTWVTRQGVHVDRMASAWLVRRFVDPGARFKFVASGEYPPLAGEVRFDMLAGEFTHQDDLCTFEVLAARLLPRDAALAALAQIIHDIDLKEETHGRPETAGLRAALEALCLTVPGDAERIERAAPLLDLLYEHFRLGPSRQEG